MAKHYKSSRTSVHTCGTFVMVDRDMTGDIVKFFDQRGRLTTKCPGCSGELTEKNVSEVEREAPTDVVPWPTS